MATRVRTRTIVRLGLRPHVRTIRIERLPNPPEMLVRLPFLHQILGTALLAVCALACCEWSVAEEATSTPDEVPSFYVRAVTGPLAGKSVCYVCRNGDRPVVAVMLRELGPDTTSLLKELDRTVNQHRADGLRCFAVLITEVPQKDSARLQTLAFDEKIDLPLTIVSEAATAGSPLAITKETAVSVVTYKDRRIVERFTYKSGSCDKAARDAIVAASEKLAKP